MTPRSAEEMLDGQRQRVDAPAMSELLTMTFGGKDQKGISDKSSPVYPR